MSHLSELRQAILDTLNTVPDIGQVHDRERFAKNNQALATFYKSGDEIKGGFIRRTRKSIKQPGIGRYAVTNMWEIRLFQSFDDDRATEAAFDDRLEAIDAAFRANAELNDVIDGSTTVIFDDQAGIQVEESQPAMFAGVLCHYARLSLKTQHLE